MHARTIKDLAKSMDHGHVLALPEKFKSPLDRHGIDFVPGCVLCHKEDCECWKWSEWIHIREGK